MIKKIFSVLMCLVFVLSLASCGGNNIASVDGNNIDKGYFDYYFNQLKSTLSSELGEDSWEATQYEGKSALEYAKERALQSVIEDYVVTQKAMEDKIALTPDDIKSMSQLKNQWISYFGSQSAFEEEIKSYGISVEQFDYMMEAVYYRNHLVEKYTEDSEELNKAFYKGNIAKVKHILLLTVNPQTGEKLAQEDVDKVRAEAEKLLELARSNGNFDALVAEYTEDQNVFYYVGEGFSLAEDGTEGSGMVPEFEDACFMLGIEEISDIVESEYGFHIIKRYENDEQMYQKAKDAISFRVRSMDFSDVLNDLKLKLKIVVNESVYNSYN